VDAEADGADERLLAAALMCKLALGALQGLDVFVEEREMELAVLAGKALAAAALLVLGPVGLVALDVWADDGDCFDVDLEGLVDCGSWFGLCGLLPM
jgi:hypothetical protein